MQIKRDKSYYYDFTSQKFRNSPLAFFVGQISPRSRVLDVGCSSGSFLSYLKNELDCEVIGIEINESAAKEAREKEIPVILGSAEDEKVWDMAKKAFPEVDVIIMADVLEHLQNPTIALGYSKKLLAQNGYVLVSIPNIAYWKVRFNLLFGSFNYEKSGILDSTHLRFFTKKTAEMLFDNSGFQSKFLGPGNTRLPRKIAKIYPRLLAFQFLYKCTIK